MVSPHEPGQVAWHGAHEAAAALSRLLRLPVTAEAFAHLEPAALGAVHAGAVVVVAFDTSGGVDGTLAVVFDDDVARRFAGRLVGQGAGAMGVLDPAALAALAELGNIAASAFLNGVARLVKRTCLPSVPRVGQAASVTVLAATLPGVGMPVATLQAGGDRFSLAFFARPA